MAGSPTKERAGEGYQVEPTHSCCSELEDSGDGGPDLLLQTLSLLFSHPLLLQRAGGQRRWRARSLLVATRELSFLLSREQRNTSARSHPRQQIGPPPVSHDPEFSLSIFSPNLPDSFWCFFFSIGALDYANNRARKQILLIDLEFSVSLLTLSLLSSNLDII
jgi:hypothetical protein